RIKMSASEAEAAVAAGVDEHDAGGSEGDTTSSSIESRRETREERQAVAAAAGSSSNWEGASSSSMHPSSSHSAPSHSSHITSLFSTLVPSTAAAAAAAPSAATAKKLFSTGASSASLTTHRHSTFSDCGSELTRSMDDLSMGRFDSKSEGTIRLQIQPVSTLRAKINTSFHSIANLPWRLAAKTENSKRTSHQKFFSVYIDCNPESESTLWHCDALVEFRLVNEKNPKLSFSRHFTNNFNYNSNNWGFPSFIEWGDLINPEKGFIKHDRIAVEATITVNKVVGVRRKPRFDFLNPSNEMSDTALVVNGVKLYISRQYLALYSPVFAAMFYGRFEERDKDEISIEDVLSDEFQELLNVLYPSHKPINCDNVEYLLELADKFQIEYIVEEAEKYLMATDEIAVVTKLLWADQYCLAKLQDSCIRIFKCPNEIKTLKTSEEYKNLSNTTKAALFEKILKLIKD
ncbi:hypothetical protein PFISCL1PPCAC_20486, partial [Pristionchus fissidentatus]